MSKRYDRMITILARDGLGCVWCGFPLQLGDAELTTEHIIPKVKGGPSWLENEVAACHGCNLARRTHAPVDYAERCAARGLQPRRQLIHARLEELSQAITARGGQRKARPYLVRELRRAQKWKGRY